MKLLCFGLGYTALHFARTRRSRFTQVTGTVRGADKARALEEQGFAMRLFGAGEPDPRLAGDIAQAGAILVSISPEEAGDPVLAAFADMIAASARLAWIGYLSTTGVYGDHGGAWIDEDTPATPSSPRSVERLAAERDWLALGARAGVPVQIFRLSGIYGPGRNALAQLASGTARRVVKAGQVFNRIHVEDIARVLEASLDRPRAVGIYDVADGAPAPSQDVIAEAARLAGVEPPPLIAFEAAGLSPMAASFYAENKRIRARRIREELGVSLAYPDYRAGLAALHAAGEGPQTA